MIPEFNEHGYLPPGIHRATLAEIEERFGRSSEIRRIQMQSLHWLADLARRAGIERLIVNGSFVTDVLEPNDVDCVLLMGPSFPRGRSAALELHAGLPFVHTQFLGPPRFDFFVNTFFATDGRSNPKGLIEVVL
jgi:hypothetical protein